MGIVIKALTAAITASTNEPQLRGAVVMAYKRLKSALEQREGAGGSLVKAIEMLEQRPTSTARVSVLEEEISAAQVEKNGDIVAMAEALLTALDLPLHLSNSAGSSSGNSAEQDVAYPVFAPRYVPVSLHPLQRPPQADYFVDRQSELTWLLSSLQPGRKVLVSGPGGVGKSALVAAVVWSLAPDQTPPANFPDGIIYYDFHRQPQVGLAWEHIVRAFEEEIWPTPRAAAQRILAERRVLLVLDGVEHADHLQDILTLKGESGILMTSRHQVAGIDEQKTVEPLQPEEAVKLLQEWSQGRAANKSAAFQVCELIGRLPLSVRLVGRYLASQEESVETYLKWLSTTSLVIMPQAQRVEAGVSTILRRTLTQLSQESQNILATLGLLAFAPVDLNVLTEALNAQNRRRLWMTIQRVFKQELTESAPTVRQALHELSSYGLVVWHGQQYSLSHPLIHKYVQQHLIAPADAAKQLIGHYTMLAGEQILLGDGDHTHLNRERPHIMALLKGCMKREEWKAAHDLAIAIEDYLDLHGHGTERVITNRIGLDAARKLGRGYNEVAWLGNLGLAYKAVGDIDQAIAYYEQALTSARDVGDQRSEGNWLGNLGLAYRDLDQVDLARQYLNQSLMIFELINSPSADVIRDWLTELEDA